MSRVFRTKEQIASDIETQTKVCCVCKERKSFEEFYNFKNKSDQKSYRCKACDYLARKKWSDNNPEKAQASQRARNLKHKYKITMDEYNKLRAKQGNRCAICGKHEDDNLIHGKFSSLSVDHDHDTGEIRGLLCNQCNRGLGMLGDSVECLTKALKYLKDKTH